MQATKDLFKSDGALYNDIYGAAATSWTSNVAAMSYKSNLVLLDRPQSGKEQLELKLCQYFFPISPKPIFD